MTPFPARCGGGGACSARSPTPVAVGAVLAAPGTTLGAALAAAEPSGRDRIPPDTRPGGAYDRYEAELAAQDRFSGVVLLSTGA
jgi:hypothetical protein